MLHGGIRSVTGHVTVERRHADPTLGNGMKVRALGIIQRLAGWPNPEHILTTRVLQLEHGRARVAMAKPGQRKAFVR